MGWISHYEMQLNYEEKELSSPNAHVVANRTNLEALSYQPSLWYYVDISGISNIMHFELDLLIAVGSAAMF